MEAPSDTRQALDLYKRTRARTEQLANRLSAEDAQIQVFPYASPTKWHLAHTTWFFDTFVVSRNHDGPPTAPDGYDVMFNSYYEGVGAQHPRHQRGALSRPSLDEVMQWRQRVDERVEELLEGSADPDITALVELGVHHEKQHQELALTDILANFSASPLKPSYHSGDSVTASRQAAGRPKTPQWHNIAGGRYTVGHQSQEEFCYDNERPSHDVLVNDFAIRDRLLTNGEVIQFIDAGGYRDHRHWLSDGITWAREHDISAPRYWRFDEHEGWMQFTLHGEQPVNPDAPAMHLAGYEAEAIASALGFRLPTEFEWEVAARELQVPISEGCFEGDRFIAEHVPQSREGDTPIYSLIGELWEWTRSSYQPYPGYQAPPGAVGEYNGKFMCNQWVLRGGSLATASDHFRLTYRNFFYPHERWQFTGARLARDL